MFFNPPFIMRLLLLFLLVVSASSAGGSYAQSAPRDAAAAHSQGAQASGLQAVPEDKARRREELRAALRAQTEEAQGLSSKPITPQERAALREQLRLQAPPSGLQQ